MRKLMLAGLLTVAAIGTVGALVAVRDTSDSAISVDSDSDSDSDTDADSDTDTDA